MRKIYVLVFALAFAQIFSAQRIMPVLDVDDVYPFHPLDGEVYAMHEWDGKLVVGGKFEMFNDQPFANVLLWDGEHAEAIGPGFDDDGAAARVTALATFGNDLIIAGRLSNEDLVYLWDGETGTYFGGDFNGIIYDLEVFNDELYAIGNFEPALQKWNGSAWEEVPTNFPAEINDLEAHNGLLYACGFMGVNDLGNLDFPGAINRFDGIAWTSLSMDPDVSEPRKMFSIDGELLVCGTFTDAGVEHGLATVNGITLEVSSLDAPPYTLSICKHGNDFYFIGKRTDSSFPVYVNDELWRNIPMPDPAVNHQVPADITAHNGKIYVAGIETISFPAFSETGENNTLGFFTIEPGEDLPHLDVNNCDVRTFPSAAIFWDKQLSTGGFEVPGGSGLSTLYASSIWATAINGNDTLAAAETFGVDGNGWPFGPVCNDLDLDYAWRYYQVWEVLQDEIEYHLEHFTEGGYITPYSIATWPGNGNFDNGEAHMLAPFTDQDNDTWYEPWEGDAPKILGDKALYFILNDQRSFHDDETFIPMNLELHVMLYAFENQTEAIDNSVFIHTTIFNRSENNYTDFRIGIWNDWDIGTATDDYVGCDVEQRVFYGYNADNMDEASSSSPGYGLNPPAQGCVFLSDGLTGHTYYNNSQNPINGEPNSLVHYYNYLHGLWKDGSSILDQYGNADSHMFNGSPCSNYENEWSAENPPGDRRAIGASESTTLDAGDYLCFDYAYVHYRNSQISNLENACTLIDIVPDVFQFWNALEIGCDVNTSIGELETGKNSGLNIWPNPASDILNIEALYLNSHNSNVIIHDILGNVVMKNNITSPGKNSVDVSSLSAGVYLLAVEGKSAVWVKE